MKKEYSYGAVIYQKNAEGNIEYLLERMTLGHTSLPKGHIENSETPLDCVHREIKEELNLEIEVNTAFSHTITYSPNPGISKDVTFFLGTIVSGEIITQKIEVLSAYWSNYDQAIQDLTHNSDKEVLEDVNNYLLKH